VEIQNSSDEDKQAVKDTVKNAKDNFNKWGTDLKSKASDLSSQVQDKVNQAKTSVEDSVNQN